MQPEQQNLNDQNQSYPPRAQQSSPQPASNIPEYLHLDPISNQPARKMRRWRLILIITPLLALSAIAIVVAALTLSSNPSEKGFYKALDTLMMTAYIKRTISVDNTAIGEKDTIIAETDFSSMKSPRSKASYTSVVTVQNGPKAKPEQHTYSGEVITNPSDSYFGRFTSPAPNGFAKIVQNTWYKSASSRYVVDPTGLHISLNNPLSQVLIGSIGDSERAQLLQTMISSGVYTINGSASKTVDDVNYTVYNVTINYAALTKVNNEMNKLLTIQQPRPTLTSSSQAVFWINTSTGRVTKITESIKNGATVNATSETKYEYPSSLTIVDPMPFEVIS